VNTHDRYVEKQRVGLLEHLMFAEKRFTGYEAKRHPSPWKHDCEHVVNKNLFQPRLFPMGVGKVKQNFSRIRVAVAEFTACQIQILGIIIDPFVPSYRN
jgi:hypothetical protein